MANNNSNLIEKLLGGSGLNQVWVKVFSLVKILTGDVDVKNKGNLQKQIDDVRSSVENMGKNQARVFQTVDELDTWLEEPSNVAQLTAGDNFYIVATDVPDYWWDGTQKQPLEGQKVDLSTYDQEINKLNEDIDNLQNQMASFDAAKGDIAGSVLGGYLGLSAVNSWKDIVNAIKTVILSGTASAEHVLEGRTFYTSSLTKQSGNMPNVPASSGITLTSSDGRKILNAREVWITNNSDGIKRICLECPTTGYYTSQSIIATPVNGIQIGMAKAEYRGVVFNKVNYNLGTTIEYYGVDFYVNTWQYYLSSEATFIATIDTDSAYWSENSQISVTAPEMSEDHRGDGGFLRFRVGIRCTERTSKVSCIIFLKLVALCPYL